MRAPTKQKKMRVIKYAIDREAEGFYETYLEHGKRIDIAFHSLHRHIAIIEPRLSRVLNRYETWDEEIDFLEWMQLDLTPYLESYIEALRIDNGGTLKDLLWTYDSVTDDWVLDDSD
jgi:hypothetical protein